jgi:cytochrome c-type biogenesis protein CcmH
VAPPHSGRPLARAALLVALALALAVPIAVRAASTVTAQEVEEGLTCQCGCGLTVANCNHPNCEFSVPAREQIEAMLHRGMTGPQVIAFFRHKYGEKILSAPTTTGFNLLAWVMPFAALMGGGIFVAVALGRWRAHPESPAPAPESNSANGGDDEMRRRLERDLREGF